MWKLETSSYNESLNKYIKSASKQTFDTYEEAQKVAQAMNQEDPETRTVVIPV